jgi:Alpha-L-arabinofuranosidase C-terminal domain
VSSTVLANADIRAHNTFENPAVVAPAKPVTSKPGANLTFTFQAASVTKLEFDLA